MEVVEMVEVVEAVGDHQQGQENFEDLILTVVPDGSEAGTITATTGVGGHRTILVTNQSDHEKDKKIESLTGRVEELENQVHFLEDELRIIRRKVIATASNIDTTVASAVRRTVLDIFSKQTLKVSLSEFEDEMGEEAELGRGARPSTSGYRAAPKKRKYDDGEDQNGLSEEEQDEDDLDYSEEDTAPQKRRRPGRPRGTRGGRVGRKSKTHRVELTPPPQKTGRPRGRPRRRVEEQENNDENMATLTPVVEKLAEPEKYADSEGTGAENDESMENEEGEEHEGDQESLEAQEAADAESKEAELASKGKRATVVADQSAVRTSTRVRRTSRKGSD